MSKKPESTNSNPRFAHKYIQIICALVTGAIAIVAAIIGPLTTWVLQRDVRTSSGHYSTGKPDSGGMRITWCYRDGRRYHGRIYYQHCLKYSLDSQPVEWEKQLCYVPDGQMIFRYPDHSTHNYFRWAKTIEEFESTASSYCYDEVPGEIFVNIENGSTLQKDQQ